MSLVTHHTSAQIVCAWHSHGFMRAAILVTNLETLVWFSPSPMLIWVLQSSHCSKIRVAQHWGRRGVNLSENEGVRSECKKFGENSRQMAPVSTICDEYCGSSPIPVTTQKSIRQPRRNSLSWGSYNLGQNKMEQRTPIPAKSRMKLHKSQNAPFSHPWFGGRGYKLPIYFVQECSLCNALIGNKRQIALMAFQKKICKQREAERWTRKNIVMSTE